MTIVYPRTCEHCHKTYKTSPSFFRHRRTGACDKSQMVLQNANVSPRPSDHTDSTAPRTVIYQTIHVTNNNSVLNYNVFPNDPLVTNKELFGDITVKQSKQISCVTEILQQNGIDGLEKTAQFIQTNFPTMQEVKTMIDNCDETVIKQSLNIDRENYDRCQKAVADANSKGVKEKTQKAENKLKVATDQVIETAIYDIFRKLLLNRYSGNSMTADTLTSSPPLFVNPKGDIKAWCETDDNGRKWLRKSDNEWQAIAHMLAARIVSNYNTTQRRYEERKEKGLDFSAKLIRKMRKDLENFCRTDTANGWFMLSDRSIVPKDTIEKLTQDASSEITQQTNPIL